MTQDSTPKFRPLPALLMVLILAALAVGGWWLKTQPPSSPSNTAPPAKSLNPPNTSQKVTLTLYLPNANAMLEKHTTEEALATPLHFKNLAPVAFSLLQKEAPGDFPAGTKLLGVQTQGKDVAVLNFNSNFNAPAFWQGSSRTLMTVYSIVNTITALPADDFKAQEVLFLVDGKPIEVLGDLEVHDPLKPDQQWVEQH